MQLTEEQKSKVAQWIADGMKLSEIQSRLGSELEIRLTYMEARMLVDDLKLLPKDPVPEAKPAPADNPAVSGAPVDAVVPAGSAEAPAPAGGVTVAAVDPRSPAARAGVKPGDVVIGFDGEPVTEPAALVLLLLRSPVGADVPLDVLRDGTRQTITVTVGRRPHERR